MESAGIKIEATCPVEELEELLAAWHEVYAGLSDDEIAEVETMALDRSRFSREDS